MLIEYNQIIQKYGLRFKNVIHIGAHYGEEAKSYYDNGVQKSIWIEANPNLIPILKKRVNYPNCTFINACLSDKIGNKISLNLSNNDGLSSSILDLSYHKIAHPDVKYIDSVEVITDTLDNVFEKNNISFEECDFMNADIQGAELLMLKGANKILPNLKGIYIEVNQKELYKGCAMLPDIDDYLSKFGFERKELVWCGDFGWGDAFYFKKQ
jgi:FkbM family methyltransferase